MGEEHRYVFRRFQDNEHGIVPCQGADDDIIFGMINGKGYGRGGAGKGVEHHHVHGGVDFHHCFLEKDGCVALGHDALLFIGQGIAVMAVLVGNLDEHQILNIPGHGGLGYSNAFIAKGFRQFLLGFNDLVLNDFLDFHDSVSFHKRSPRFIPYNLHKCFMENPICIFYTFYSIFPCRSNNFCIKIRFIHCNVEFFSFHRLFIHFAENAEIYARQMQMICINFTAEVKEFCYNESNVHILKRRNQLWIIILENTCSLTVITVTWTPSNLPKRRFIH